MLGARRDVLHYHLYLTINMLLWALISAILATAAAAGECNKTITFGMLSGAGPGAVLSPSNWLDHGGTCFTWHRQPSAPWALE